jgi:hypothetical protein
VRADLERISSLERGLKEVREQADRQDQDLVAVRKRVEEQEALTQRQVADVTDHRQTERRDRRDFAALNDKLAGERVDFEVSKDHQSDVALGNHLGRHRNRHALPSHHGWVWLTTDRTIWIRNQAT